MESGKCKCASGGNLIDLALCLAPPRGEYEVEIKMGSNTSIVVNEEGIFYRTIVTDETLPFVKTYERPIDPSKAVEKLGGEYIILCKSVEMLKKAATHGSILAERKIKSCMHIIRQVEAACGGEETL